MMARRGAHGWTWCLCVVASGRGYCLCTGGLCSCIMCSVGGLWYLHDVNSQLTVAVAIQLLGSYILGPALGLQLQGSGHQFLHIGLEEEG